MVEVMVRLARGVACMRGWPSSKMMGWGSSSNIKGDVVGVVCWLGLWARKKMVWKLMFGTGSEGETVVMVLLSAVKEMVLEEGLGGGVVAGATSSQGKCIWSEQEWIEMERMSP